MRNYPLTLSLLASRGVFIKSLLQITELKEGGGEERREKKAEIFVIS